MTHFISFHMLSKGRSYSFAKFLSSFSPLPPQVVFDRPKGMALILYKNIEYAQAAVKETKGWKIGGNKIKVSKKTILN